MQLAFIIIFATILIVTVLCILKFKSYKEDFIKTIDIKRLSLRFVLGFCALCIDRLYKLSFFKSSTTYNKTKKLVTSVNVGEPPEKSIYIYHLRLVSYTIVTVLILSFLGLAYTANLSTNDDNAIVNIKRPENGDGSQNISIIADSELYSGQIDITVDDKKLTFDEAMEIFAANRTAFDMHVLNNNSSFLHIDSPLNLPNVWGNENIAISWFIGSPDIIDYTGSLIEENIVSSGVPVEIVATMTLDDISADICYQLMVFPPKLSDKDILVNYLNKFINSEHNLTEDIIALPDNILGFDITYTDNEKVFPTVDIFNSRMLTLLTYSCS